MKIHIVGAGPTGMSLAWEILRVGDHDITIYDRKPSAGGSWWEPDVNTRDLHAHRIVFDRAFVNTKSLFNEMGIEWDSIFQPVKKDIYGFMYNSLEVKDYKSLAFLASRVLLKPNDYKHVSLKDALGELSETGKKFIEHLPLIMDGVTWDIMSAYEFVKNFDHVALSNQYTQRVSGKVMSDAMQKALEEKGVEFVFEKEIEKIQYLEDGFSAEFTDETIIDTGVMILCIDNSPALKLIGDNWGPDAHKKIRQSTYGCINVILDFEEPLTLEDDLKIAANTRWKLQPVVLSDGKTISCVICNLTEEVLTSSPEEIRNQVLLDLKDIPLPKSIRFGWGSKWNEELKKWEFTQSSGVLSLYGQVPFFGKSPNIALCGMMSPRNTPYSSIEAAIEVSRSFCNQTFGTRPPIRPLLLTQLISLLLVILIVLILVYTNRNQ